VTEPTARRPGFPKGYGISTDAKGMLPWSWAEKHLEAGRSYWIVTTRPDGRPHAMPVWGVWLDGAVHWSSSADSVKARNLARDPRVVVHLDSGDDVVILEGEVETGSLDERLADAYEAKYQFRPEPSDEGGGWFRLSPRMALAWTEQDYPRTATRFDF
jgi:PPOX class probable F420-dependent enzyme